MYEVCMYFARRPFLLLVGHMVDAIDWLVLFFFFGAFFAFPQTFILRSCLIRSGRRARISVYA